MKLDNLQLISHLSQKSLVVGKSDPDYVGEIIYKQ